MKSEFGLSFVIVILTKLLSSPDADANHQGKAKAEANVEETSKEIIVSCCLPKNHLDGSNSMICRKYGEIYIGSLINLTNNPKLVSQEGSSC